MEPLKYPRPQLPEQEIQEVETEGEAHLPRERETKKHPFS